MLTAWILSCYHAFMEKNLHPVLAVRVFREEKCFGPGIAALLTHVRELRSLRAAAMTMGMAYSKAWTIVKTSEENLGFKLLQSTTGGKNGGGAILTAEAEKLLLAYEAYCSELKTYSETLFAEKFRDFL